MRDLEHACMMFQVALKDRRALEGMLDINTFADAIFGFHAQQAVEKTLKAWLSLVGKGYPKIHDLEALLALLEDKGEIIPQPLYRLIDLTDFAVQLRYELTEYLEEPLDRPVIIQQIRELMDYVQRLLQQLDGNTDS